MFLFILTEIQETKLVLTWWYIQKKIVNKKLYIIYSILDWFLKDYVTLKTGVMMITGIK